MKLEYKSNSAGVGHSLSVEPGVYSGSTLQVLVG